MFLETVAIKEVHDDVEGALTANCSHREICWLKTAPVQTVAGQVALKTALVTLVAHCFDTIALKPQQVEIFRHPDGAPHLAPAADLPAALIDALTTRVRVSISHTREYAVGLAVLSGPNKG